MRSQFMYQSLGEPMFNLMIEARVNFWNYLRTCINPFECIKPYNSAINSAKKNLSGVKAVTDKGYLCKEKIDGLPIERVRLDPYQNIRELLTLDILLQQESGLVRPNGRIIHPDSKIKIHITYPNGGIDYICNQGSLLYLEGRREAYSLKIEGDELRGKNPGASHVFLL
jgi:hypothetical protein